MMGASMRSVNASSRSLQTNAQGDAGNMTVEAALMNQKTTHRRFSISSFPQAFKNQSMTSYAEDEQGEPDEDLTESVPFRNMMNSLKALNVQMEELAEKDEQFQSDNGNFEFHDLTPGEQDRIMREQGQMLPLDFDTDTLYYKMGVIGGMAEVNFIRRGTRRWLGLLAGVEQALDETKPLPWT